MKIVINLHSTIGLNAGVRTETRKTTRPCWELCFPVRGTLAIRTPVIQVMSNGTLF